MTLKEMLKLTIWKVIISVIVVFILVFLYFGTIPAIGANCLHRGGDLVWVGYNYYCVSGTVLLLARGLNLLIWAGLIIIVYTIVSLVWYLIKQRQIQTQTQ